MFLLQKCTNSGSQIHCPAKMIKSSNEFISFIDASEESSVLETSTASQDDSILEEASTSAIDESMPSTTEPRLSASDDIAPPIQMIDDDEQAVSQSESDQQQEVHYIA